MTWGIRMAARVMAICSVVGVYGACHPPTPPAPDAQVIEVTTARSWEYRELVVSAPSHEKTGPNALATNELKVDVEQLNKLGTEGWELAGTYLEVETAFANLGDPKYVTGLQPNVRPMRLVMLFKRARR